jgi:hypothetical protein
VSRKAIAVTKPTVDEFRTRKIDHLDLVVLFLDGVNVATRQVIVCVGVDSGGKKHVLGLKNGATENEFVCQDLIDDLKEKGLNTEKKYLFVIDGSKALAKTIRASFGPNAAIQRCQEHKIRNVQAYLPRKYWDDVRKKNDSGVHWLKGQKRSKSKKVPEASLKFPLLRSWWSGQVRKNQRRPRHSLILSHLVFDKRLCIQFARWRYLYSVNCSNYECGPVQ